MAGDFHTAWRLHAAAVSHILKKINGHMKLMLHRFFPFLKYYLFKSFWREANKMKVHVDSLRRIITRTQERHQ